jgi:hypothetical protein
MTFERPDEEGAEEAIEDLEAPADAQSDVAGGQGCGKPSAVCLDPTCAATDAVCLGKAPLTNRIVVFEE